MIIYRIFAFAWLITLPILAHTLVKLARLERFRLNLADLSLPLYAFAIVRVSQLFFKQSFLPHYLVVMSVLAIVICGILLRKKDTFMVKRFCKLYWRIGFFVSLAFYLFTLIATFSVTG